LQSGYEAIPGNQEVSQNQSGRIEGSRSTIIMISVATAVTLIGAAASAIAVRSEPARIADSSSYEVEHQTAPKAAPRTRTRGISRSFADHGATDSSVYSTRSSNIRRQL
jgi:hypothetical protein